MDKIPKHVAIIMDGNGRWASERHLTRPQGHLEGVKRVEEIVEAAREAGIAVLTLYAFSTENWSRPQHEVSMLMRTFITVLGQKAKQLHANGIRIHFIGRRQGVPEAVLQAMDQAMDLTRGNAAMTLNVAFNYGSRAEVVDALKAIVDLANKGQIKPADVNEETVNQHLYTHGQPDPDLLIRTSGEQRISNFLLWQLSYAELYFTSKYWPDFTKKEFQRALEDFAARERRYGGVGV